MNKKNISDLIEHLENLSQVKPKDDIGFSMTTFMAIEKPHLDSSGHRCETVACLAGHACLEKYKSISTAKYSIKKEAKKFLGIDEDDVADNLFLDDPSLSKELDGISVQELQKKVTLKEAIQTLKIFRDTGKVDWSHAIERLKR